MHLLLSDVYPPPHFDLPNGGFWPLLCGENWEEARQQQMGETGGGRSRGKLFSAAGKSHWLLCKHKVFFFPSWRTRKAAEEGIVGRVLLLLVGRVHKSFFATFPSCHHTGLRVEKTCIFLWLYLREKQSMDTNQS